MDRKKRIGNGAEYFSFQVTPEMRDGFLAFCKETGLTVSDAVTMLTLRTVERKEIPFSMGIDALAAYVDAIRLRKEDGDAVRMAVRMTRQNQDALMEACGEMCVNRSALVRLFFARCMDEGRLVLDTTAEGPHREELTTDFDYVSIQIDPDVRDRFKAVCDRSDRTVGEAAQALARRTIRASAIPFDVVRLPMFPADAPEQKTVRMLIRMDPDTQASLMAVCDAIGVMRSSLFRMYFMRCANDGKLILI